MKYSLFTLLLVVFLAAGCDKDSSDPCEGVTCLNGGVCLDGSCDCPDGYTGTNCTTELVPTTIFVESLTVTRFPAVDDSGGQWDSAPFFENPDLKLVIQRNGTTFYESSQVFDDATSGLNYVFSNLNIQLTNPSVSTYALLLVDDDTSTDEFMGGFEGVFWATGSGFPLERTLDVNTNVAFDLKLRYAF